MDTQTFFSPAKINLFFRVLYRRHDGFHEIASVYQAISLGDTFTIALAEEDQLTSSDPFLLCDQSNLVFRSLDVFRRYTGYRFCVHMHLKKQIPMESGLGGGSSNAATAMWALNGLFNHLIPIKELSSWVGEFSSDAPFFFSKGTAYCQGRGELIKEIPAMEPIRLWIAKPQMGLSTPLVYQHCRPEQFLPRDPDQSLAQLLQQEACYFNDLEIPAFALQPELITLKQELLQLGFTHVTMTGSGTAFFCVGSMREPQLPGVSFYPVSFHFRSNENWYPFSNEE